MTMFVDQLDFARLEATEGTPEQGVQAVWRSILGLGAYAGLAPRYPDPFLSCPLNAVIRYKLDRAGHTLRCTGLRPKRPRACWKPGKNSHPAGTSSAPPPNRPRRELHHDTRQSTTPPVGLAMRPGADSLLRGRARPCRGRWPIPLNARRKRRRR